MEALLGCRLSIFWEIGVALQCVRAAIFLIQLDRERFQFLKNHYITIASSLFSLYQNVGKRTLFWHFERFSQRKTYAFVKKWEIRRSSCKNGLLRTSERLFEALRMAFWASKNGAYILQNRHGNYFVLNHWQLVCGEDGRAPQWSCFAKPTSKQDAASGYPLLALFF